MGFAEVAFVAGPVVPRVCLLCAQLFEARATALAARLVDERRCAFEHGADRAGRIRCRRVLSHQDPAQDELRIALEDWRATAQRRRDRLVGLLARTTLLAEVEVRFR